MECSILDPILFNIFLCGKFFLLDSVDIASYAGDNNPHAIGKNKFEIENNLKIASVKLFKWFHEKGTKANQDECHYLSSFDITTELSLPDCSFENSSSEKLIGVIIDRKLNSMSMLQICAIKPVTQRKLLNHVYFLSQFGYCPLVCINHSRILMILSTDFTKKNLD